MTRTVRIAMWSGPRNVSTALMRSFEARPDTVVVDEPFYGAYLRETGLDHPLAAEVMAAQPNDWREVVARLLGPLPGVPILYQKHMTHHMLPNFGRDWLAAVRSAFLIRDPAAVLASYVQQRTRVTLADIGIVQQRALFDQEAQRLGRAPAVIDGADLVADPARVLPQLCAALSIEYTEAMLSWRAGPRPTDGVWAPAWYAAVERSTGFEAPPPRRPQTALPSELQPIAEAARPLYDSMFVHRLK